MTAISATMIALVAWQAMAQLFQQISTRYLTHTLMLARKERTTHLESESKVPIFVRCLPPRRSSLKMISSVRQSSPSPTYVTARTVSVSSITSSKTIIPTRLGKSASSQRPSHFCIVKDMKMSVSALVGQMQEHPGRAVLTLPSTRPMLAMM